MFDFNYYNELCEINYLYNKHQKYVNYLQSTSINNGNKVKYQRKYQKNIIRQQRMNELILKHTEYYVYFINEVYGKNKLQKIEIQGKNAPDTLNVVEELTQPLPRRVKRIY